MDSSPLTEHPPLTGPADPGRPRGSEHPFGPAVAASAAGAERGSVTAEYAVMLPAAALVLVGALLAGAATLQQVRLEEAAAASVRELARGESESDVRSTARRMAGEATDLSSDRSTGWVAVTVAHAPPGPLAWWDGWELEATAHAPDQWAVPPTRTP
ncbi:TadE family protein [Citricoccus sp. NPDC079358]|uniref:TadE family protein n=1 Tax=Citricoccus sp. NPDC079358 TaxID=3154653 RepID=UPI00344CD78C